MRQIRSIKRSRKKEPIAIPTMAPVESPPPPGASVALGVSVGPGGIGVTGP